MNEERLDVSGLLMRERVRARLTGAVPRALRVGRFELRQPCGSGGEGLVYEAWDTQAETSVALKCLNSVRAGQQAALQQEFRALSHLVHPNLVAMRELFCVDGAWFFTMELVAGTDIVRYTRAQPDRLQTARTVITQLLRGLAAIHAGGFVHRDVKPSNVLVEPNGRVVLVDFGLVIPEAHAAQTRGGAGTPLYMAPEQAAGAAPAAAADLYGVGAIVFELLTGTRFDPLRAPLTRVDTLVPPEHAGAPRADDLTRELAALCRALLARDPAARPSADQALLRLAGKPEGTRALRLPREPPTCFVARTRELARLHGALSRSAEGEPRILLVHGESGIGKSALLAHFADELRARCAALVFAGRCYERENTPYKVFDELVTGLVRHLRTLPEARVHTLMADLADPLQQLFPAFARQRESPLGEPRAARLHAEDARPRAFAALRELLCRIGQDGPIVLAVDDLQWGDLDSALLLEALFACSARLPLLLVGSYRSEEAETSPFLKSFLCMRGLGPPACEIEQFALGALLPDDARALVVQLTPSRVASRLLESARGIPFLLVEAALAGPDHAASGQVDVAALFARRVDGTSAKAQALLAVLAVAGRPLSVALSTRAVSGLECGFETALELASLRLARFRDLDGERCLEPYHDRVRDLIVARLDASRVRALHLSIAEAMESVGADEPLRQVEHLCAAGERARAARLAVRASEQASAQHAWSRAADLLGAALEMGADEPHTLHRRLANALSFAGRHAESAAAYMRAAHAQAASGRAELERLAARQYVRAGHTQAGRSLLERALAESGPALPRSQAHAALALLRSRLWALFTESLRRGTGRDLPLAKTPLAAPARTRLATLEVFHRELGPSHPIQSALAHSWYCREAARGSRSDRVKALTSEVVVLALADGPRARRATARLLQRASALSEGSFDPYGSALLLYARAVAAIHADWCPRAAIAPLMRADALLREHCPGSQTEQVWVALALEHVFEITGQLVAFVKNVRAREQNEQAGQRRSLSVVSGPLVLLLEDRPQAAFQMVVEHLRERREILPLIDLLALGRGAEVLLYMGEAARAREHFVSERRRLGFQLVLRGRAVAESEQFQLARIAAALYWATRAPSFKREVERRVSHARRLPPLAWAQFRLLEASVARCAGQLADCRRLLSAASSAFGQADGEHGVWCARYREAQLDRSEERLAQARAWFMEQGVRDPERWVSLSIPGLGDWG